MELRKRSEGNRTTNGSSEPHHKRQELVLPVDPVNEQVVIAAAAASDDVRKALVRNLPNAEVFLVEEHRRLWAAILEMERRKLAFDYATLQRVAPPPINVDLLAELVQLRPDVPDNLDYHVAALKWDRSRASAAVGPISALLEALHNPRESPERVRAVARHVGEFFDHATSPHVIDTKALIQDTVASVKVVPDKGPPEFGIKGLDYYEDGRRRVNVGTEAGKVTVVTGVSGGGKSTFTGWILLGQVAQKNRTTYGTWEMSGRESLLMLAAQALDWSRADLRRGLGPNGPLKDHHEDVVRLEEEMHRIGEYVRFVRNPFQRRRGGRERNEDNLDTIHQLIEDTDAQVFVFDLWKRCLRSARPEDEEEALTRQQAMLEETGCHGILLQQQRFKDIEMRPDKRPTREGIKGSGAWVEVADTILGVHRPALWKRMDDDKLEVIILKQRFGEWPLAVEFDWHAARGRISGGRSVKYDQPGELGGDVEQVSFMRPPKKRRK